MLLSSQADIKPFTFELADFILPGNIITKQVVLTGSFSTIFVIIFASSVFNLSADFKITNLLSAKKGNVSTEFKTSLPEHSVA